MMSSCDNRQQPRQTGEEELRERKEAGSLEEELTDNRGKPGRPIRPVLLSTSGITGGSLNLKGHKSGHEGTVVAHSACSHLPSTRLTSGLNPGQEQPYFPQTRGKGWEMRLLVATQEAAQVGRSGLVRLTLLGFPARKCNQTMKFLPLPTQHVGLQAILR